MSRPRFLADEDLRGSIVRAVRRMAESIEITTVMEQGLTAIDDAGVLQFAWNERWIVVSHDVNTMRAEAERWIHGPGLHGLLLAQQSKPTLDIAKSLILIAEASEFEEWRDRIVFLPI